MSLASHALGHIDTLHRLEPHQLATVLARRGIPVHPDATALSLAKALVEPDAITRHLSQLTSEQLAGLAQYPRESGNTDQEWIDQLLVWSDGMVSSRFPEVDEVWQQLSVQLTPGSPADETSSGGTRVEPDVSAVFAGLEQLERLLRDLETNPVLTPCRPDRSELQGLAKLREESVESLAKLVDASCRLGLTHYDETGVRVTTSGQKWRSRGPRVKWLSLLVQWRDSLPTWWPRALPATLTAQSVAELAAHDYPLVDATGAQLLVEDAERLGLSKAGQTTTVNIWSDSLGDDLQAILPPEATQLYPDGPDSVIATGPLSDESEQMVRSFSRWISGHLAPRFRISQASVCAALQRGVPADELMQRVQSFIPSGMGNTITEMVVDAIDQATSLSVSADGATTLVRSSHPLRLSLILADRRLSEASFSDSHEGLTSPLSPERIHELLLAEGYPHLVTTASGDVVVPPEAQAEHAPEGWSVDAATALLERLNTEHSRRQLVNDAVELAIAEKCPIALDVAMGENTVTIRLEPHALKNGRLRGRDTRSDVERTIPVSHVVGVKASD